jgi:pilus assembly protein CpaB
MRIGTIVSLGASAALGLGALVVARVWLPNHPARTQGQAAATAGVPVVVASSPIAYGAKLEAKNLTVAMLPAEAAPLGAFATVDQVMKLDGGAAPVSLVSISQKEPVLAAKLSPGSRPSLATMIAPGMRAYTIGVTETAGVGGHALPGDRVDVVLTRDNSATPTLDGGHSAHLAADVVIQNVKLLGMDLNEDQTSGKPAVAHTATLEVSVQDAERLAVATQAGTLTLALRRTGGSEIEAVRPMLTSDLGPAGPAAAGPRSMSLTPVRRRVARPPAAPIQSGVSVIVVHGEKSESVSVPVAAFGAGV